MTFVLAMLLPTEILRPMQAAARQLPRQSGGFTDSTDALRQFLGSESRKIHRCIPANFAVHRQVRSHHGQTARHRFDERVGERLSISGSHINVAGAIKMMQGAVRDASQFDDVATLAQTVEQRRCSLGLIASRIIR